MKFYGKRGQKKTGMEIMPVHVSFSVI